MFNVTFEVFRSRVVSARFPSSLKTEGGASSKPFDAMPGSKPLPFIGNSWEVNNNLKMTQLLLLRCFENYGDVYRLKGMGTL